MGGALAVLAAAERPERIARLTLISPAGLPLQKSMTASLADFARQVVLVAATPRPTRWSRSAAHSPRRAPRCRLAREVHALDLSLEMERVRRERRPGRGGRLRVRHARHAVALPPAGAAPRCELPPAAPRRRPYVDARRARAAGRRSRRLSSRVRHLCPSLATVVRDWGRIGCIGFGGPPAHISLLRRLVVDERGWLPAEEFEDAVAACNLLPGPASTQLAILCARRVRGAAGAVAGGLAFIVPGLR